MSNRFSRLVASFTVTVTVIAEAESVSAQVFGDPSVLSNTLPNSDVGHDWSPQVTTDGAGNWVAVWQSGDSLGGTIGDDDDILVSRSTDGGATWTAPATLNTNAATDNAHDESPQVTTDGAGNWIAVWHAAGSLGGTIGLDRDLLVARSTNNGATWTAPAALNTNAASDAGDDFEAQIETDGAGNWVVVWVSVDDLGGTIGADRDILVSRSTNNGVTWTAPAALNTNAAVDSAYDTMPQVTTDGAGNWVAVWSSDDSLGGTIGTDFDILVSRSTNNGATWTAPAALDTNAAADSTPDYYPQVTTDNAGNWVAVWTSQNSLGGTIGTDGDILVARSTDGGATWTAPAALNTNAATDSEYDYMAQVTTDSAGSWVAVWQSTDTLGGTIGTDLDILVARSTNNGATWTATAALNTNAATDSGDDWSPQVTTDGAGSWVAVWHSYDSLGDTIGTEADILFSRSTNSGATWTATAALNTNAAADTDDYQPQVTTDGSGNWVAVWSSNDDFGGTIGLDADILVSRSTDSGVTWTALAALNTNAGTDTGDDSMPQVTTDGAGNWVAVWSSDDDLGGTIGLDADILVSRSTNNGATWTAPAALNTNAAADSGSDARPQVTTDGAGNWVAVWTSDDSLGGTIGTDADILVSRSTNNGATWTAPVALNTNAAADSGQDLAPQVTTDDAGNWVAVWDSDDSLGGTIGTDADILVSLSTNNGATWTVPGALNTNAAADAGEDLQPQVTTDGAGNWVAAWTSNDTLGGMLDTNYDIAVSRSTSNGATWTAPAKLAQLVTGDDDSPQVTTDGAGTWLAVWASRDTLNNTIGGDADILVARSTDNGATWPQVSALNTNAAADAGNDYEPQLTTDGADNWVAIWHSADTLGGTASWGWLDIFAATGRLCGDSFIDGAEQCDDGNYDSGDCCSPGCEAEIIDASSCFAAPSTKLQISDSSDNTKDKLSWQWGKGDEVMLAELGTPLSTTDYTLCVFDMTSSVPSIAAILEIPASMTFWTDKDAKGFQYKDPAGTAAGVTGLSVTPGAATRSKVKLKARGAAIGLPGAFDTQYFAQNPKVVAQLTNSNGACWTSEFVPDDTSRNDVKSFKAKTK